MLHFSYPMPPAPCFPAPLHSFSRFTLPPANACPQGMASPAAYHPRVMAALRCFIANRYSTCRLPRILGRAARYGTRPSAQCRWAWVRAKEGGGRCGEHGLGCVY